MTYDYTDAPEQRGNELIPADTVATVQLTIRLGGAGEGGLLKRSQDGGCEMLDCELVVVDGPHMKRKLWERMIISGTTDGHAKAAEISRGKLRAFLESARGIKPNDTSKEARNARTAELGEDASREDSRRSQLEVIAQVVRFYWDTQLGAEEVNVAAKAMRSAEADLEHSEARRASGMRSNPDSTILRTV